MPATQRTPAGRITFYSREILRSVDDRIERAMRQTVFLLENRVKTLQTGSRTGYWYRIGKTPTKSNLKMGIKTGRWYQASAPGEPPAVKSSRLFRSITSRVEAVHAAGGGIGWKGEVGTNVQDYPPALEFGVKAAEGAKPSTRAKRMTIITYGKKYKKQPIIARVFRKTFAGGWRVAPRPLWRRALTELRGQIKAMWDAAAAAGPRGRRP